uniref:BTB domain-containing protein n=1 Tax=Bursaphelenchus xylophilus TaxID=6326 RepID=A0A1I7RXN9_BURXY
MCCKENYWHQVAVNITRLRNEGLYCDLQIVCEDQVFNVHKVLMAAGVSYFRHMLRSGMLESSHNRVELTNVTPEALAAIVDFVYTGRTELSNKNAVDILLAANFLMVDELQARCVQFFIENIDNGNCFKVWRLEKELGLSKELARIVDKFVVENFEFVFNNPEVGLLDFEGLRKILKDDHLKVRSEDQVLIAALHWLQYDIEERIDHTDELLNCIRITYLNDVGRVLDVVVSSLEKIDFFLRLFFAIEVRQVPSSDFDET